MDELHDFCKVKYYEKFNTYAVMDGVDDDKIEWWGIHDKRYAEIIAVHQQIMNWLKPRMLALGWGHDTLTMQAMREEYFRANDKIREFRRLDGQKHIQRMTNSITNKRQRVSED